MSYFENKTSIILLRSTRDKLMELKAAMDFNNVGQVVEYLLGELDES
jgi:hypothetical protein